jgi:hypothetical protein
MTPGRTEVLILGQVDDGAGCGGGRAQQSGCPLIQAAQRGLCVVPPVLVVGGDGEATSW